MKSFKNFKNISFKKLLPSFISLVVVVCMAASTFTAFATGIDLEAFIKKDEYKTRLYEVEFKINNIEKELDRIYKFTCTNVRTYGGSQYLSTSNVHQRMFAPHVTGTSTNPFQYSLTVDMSQDKYMRVGFGSFLGWSSSTYDTANTLRELEYEIPASEMKWREGIVPMPNCKLMWKGTLTGIINSNYTMSITMGPFKKFPAITSTGATISSGYICELPTRVWGTTTSGLTFKYAFGSETEPTTWTTENTSKMDMSTVYRGTPNYSKFPFPNEEDIKGYREKEILSNNNMVFSLATSAFNKLDGKENSWLQITWSGTNAYSGFSAILDPTFASVTNRYNRK